VKGRKEEFVLQGAADFVRLDGLCAELLLEYFRWLQTEAGRRSSAREASALAHHADRYVRDFLVDFLESGPGDEEPRRVRQYLGNWYIVQTLTPTHEEIEGIRDALERLYAFLESMELVSGAARGAFREALSDGTLYHERLEGFWALTPEQIEPWRQVDDYRPDLPRCRAGARASGQEADR
jgi:hypothetical protein